MPRLSPVLISQCRRIEVFSSHLLTFQRRYHIDAFNRVGVPSLSPLARLSRRDGLHEAVASLNTLALNLAH